MEKIEIKTKVSNNFYDFDLDLKTDKGSIVGNIERKGSKYCIRLISSDRKSSIRREIYEACLVDIAKLLINGLNYRCRKCRKKLSLEKGEIHHGCLSCL